MWARGVRRIPVGCGAIAPFAASKALLRHATRAAILSYPASSALGLVRRSVVAAPRHIGARPFLLSIACSGLYAFSQSSFAVCMHAGEEQSQELVEATALGKHEHAHVLQLLSKRGKASSATAR